MKLTTWSSKLSFTNSLAFNLKKEQEQMCCCVISLAIFKRGLCTFDKSIAIKDTYDVKWILAVPCWIRINQIVLLVEWTLLVNNMYCRNWPDEKNARLFSRIRSYFQRYHFMVHLTLLCKGHQFSETGFFLSTILRI